MESNPYIGVFLKSNIGIESNPIHLPTYMPQRKTIIHLHCGYPSGRHIFPDVEVDEILGVFGGVFEGVFEGAFFATWPARVF